jgi:hypothetical protein
MHHSLRILNATLLFLLVCGVAAVADEGTSVPASDDIFAAIRRGDTALIERILAAHGTNATAATLSGITPLHLAAALNNTEAASLLIAAGANMEQTNSSGFTPMHWAASRDAVETFELLIRHGANPEARTPEGITPLHWAAGNNATNVLRMLLLAGVKSAPTQSGMTPLHWAVMKRSDATAMMLAYQQASEDVEKQDTPQPQTPAQVDSPQPPKTTAAVESQQPGTDKAESADTAPAEATNATPHDVFPAESLQPGHPAGSTNVAIPVVGRALIVNMGMGEILPFAWIESLRIWFGRFEITNGQFRRFRQRHSSMASGALSLNRQDQPVVHVSWNDAQSFCVWLNQTFAANIPAGYEFRLPTVAEWRAVARCGDKRIYPWGDKLPPKYGNYSDLSARAAAPENWQGLSNYDDGYPVTCPVFDSGENEWGVFGMAGNVWEWCEDWYETSGEHRARMGASWDFDDAKCLKIDWCGFDNPDAGSDTVGIRLVVSKR